MSAGNGKRIHLFYFRKYVCFAGGWRLFWLSQSTVPGAYWMHPCVKKAAFKSGPVFCTDLIYSLCMELSTDVIVYWLHVLSCSWSRLSYFVSVYQSPPSTYDHNTAYDTLHDCLILYDVCELLVFLVALVLHEIRQFESLLTCLQKDGSKTCERVCLRRRLMHYKYQ